MNASSQITVFDRALLRRRRDRAANRFSAHAILFDEAAALLVERLDDVKKNFTSILDLGAHDGSLSRRLAERQKAFVAAADISEQMARRADVPAVVADEEFLPFAQNSFDLVTSNLGLHWINDLPGTLAQIKYALRPDGLFLASLLGGNTLHELRTCLLEAEVKVTGGASPRLSPTLDLQTASGLLQRAGFALPVADQETFAVTYPDMFALMRDMRGMGETNAHIQRLRHPTRRSVLIEAGRIYQERFGDAQGGIHATFDILFMHGWKPTA